MRIPRLALVLGSLSACSSGLDGAWQGACELTDPSPQHGASTWSFAFTLTEFELDPFPSSFEGFVAYTVDEATVEGADYTYSSLGGSVQWCARDGGCGDTNDPAFPSVVAGHVYFALQTPEPDAGYPNAQLLFEGTADTSAMSGPCRHDHQPFNTITDQPAFQRDGTFTAGR